MKTTTFIYALTDPRDHSIKYVGKADSPASRFSYHFKKEETRKSRWVHSLRSLNMRPLLEVIEEVSLNDWQDSERFWISYLKFLGFDLTNTAIGGLGGGPSVMPEETKAKLRVALKGRVFSEDHKKRISDAAKSSLKAKAHRATLNTPHRAAKISAGHKASQRSAEWVRILGGRPRTPEHQAKLTNAYKVSPKAIAHRKHLSFLKRLDALNRLTKAMEGKSNG